MDKFHTSITVTEGLENNRPIHFVLAGDDILPLAPNFLLFGRNLNLNNNSEIMDPEGIKDPDYKLSNADSLELRGKRLKGIIAEISRRWQQEYLTALYEKDKLRQGSGPSTKYQLEAKVGDIVQIVDEDKEQLGKIIKLLTSHDGQIRRAQVLYKNRISIQPLKNLRHIECI